MSRIEMPGGWYIKPDDETAIESEYWLYDEQHTGILIAAFERDGAEQFAAAMNAPRPSEAALVAEVERLSVALDKAIEQITAHLVHGDVSREGWQSTLDELVAAQQKQEG